MNRLGSLLRDQKLNVTILEKRAENTRERHVKLLGRIFDTNLCDGTHFLSDEQLKERHGAIESIEKKLFCKIVGWLEMATPIKTIQEQLKEYFELSGGSMLSGDAFNSEDINLLMNFPNCLVIDCTGYHSVLRDKIQLQNKTVQHFEHVIVWSFKINAHYECNKLCKYFKNKNTQKYQIIPSIDNSYTDVEKAKSHVTSLITIDEDVFNRLAKAKPLTYNYLKENFPEISNDMDAFLKNLTNDLSDQLTDKNPIDSMEFVALPLHIYKAKKRTHIATDDNLNQPWALMGDSAMGGPYFQSISNGWEAAIYFAYIFNHMNGDVEQMLKKYDEYMERLWLRMLFRSREIHRNKELFRSLFVEDMEAILRNIEVL